MCISRARVCIFLTLAASICSGVSEPFDLVLSSQSSCDAIAELPCVFVIALGRTGSTHILRLLNAIKGYRISGETSDAWVYMGHYARQRDSPKEAPANTKGTLRVRGDITKDNTTLCQMREMMLLLHNPYPRARCAIRG